MKTHHHPPGWRPQPRAFTLIELLVVIAIISILAALTMGTFTIAQQSSSRNRTTGALSAIVNGLEQYKEKHGEYPEPANPGAVGTGTGGTSMRIGGALMLYQAITGDGTSEIKMDAASGASPSPSNGEISDTEREFSIRGDLPKTMILNSSNGYMLIDGFGRPFQYEKGGSPDAVNTTYDIWSVAQLDPSKIGDIYGASSKKDAARTAAWIKNW